jgi:hypothetical protein
VKTDKTHLSDHRRSEELTFRRSDSSDAPLPSKNSGPANKSKPRGLKKRWQHLGLKIQITIIAIIILLAALRIAMPYIVKDYVNKQLAKLPEYTGHVNAIDIHLWRGAYKIRDLQISKTGGAVPVPFFSAPAIDISLQWRELFHGSVVGEIAVEEPQLNFVSGPTDKESQSGKGQPWEKTVQSFYPFDLNQFEIRNGNVHFKDFFKSKPVDIYITNLYLVATNLTNTRDKKEKLPAGVTARAQALGDGQFTMAVKLDPLALRPTYELNATLTNVDLTALNDFLRAYAKADVEKGRFSLFTSVASVDGNYQGFIKVLFQNLDVFAWDKERKKNILQIFWEGILGTLSAGFKNHPHDQLATQIPISGSYTNSHVGVFPAVGNLLKNAFIRALVPNIGKPVQVQDVEKKVGNSPSPSSGEVLPSKAK